MQRVANFRILKSVRQTASRMGVRSFSVDEKNLKINKVIDQISGIRWQELQSKSMGKTPFNDKPIIPDGDAGTFEKPIVVFSHHESRIVGFEDPSCHQVQWFELQAGHHHYIPDIGLYFVLEQVPETLPFNQLADDIKNNVLH